MQNKYVNVRKSIEPEKNKKGLGGICVVNMALTIGKNTISICENMTLLETKKRQTQDHESGAELSAERLSVDIVAFAEQQMRRRTMKIIQSLWKFFGFAQNTTKTGIQIFLSCQKINL